MSTTKVKGTVKWFNNRKGYGFVTPSSDNSPTEEDIFVHQTSIDSGNEYRTLAEGADVEFDVVTEEESGKYKAVNVTGPDGAQLKPPPKRARRPKAEVTGEEGDGAAEGEGRGGRGNRRGGRNGRGKKERVDPIPPFHAVITDDIKERIQANGLDLGQKSTVDVSVGDSRFKLGRGGYCGYCSSEALIGEGTYTCDEQGILSFEWKHALEYSGNEWQLTDAGKIVTTLDLSTAGVTSVQDGETPASLWGEGKEDPRAAFVENGFQMRRVVLTRPADPRMAVAAETEE